MSGKLHAVRGTAAATAEAIAPERLLEGAPLTQTRIDYERDEKIFAGEWAAGIGAWRVGYDEWEFCHVLEGACELVPDDGPPQRFSVGDSFVIEPGFVGVWRVLQPMRKRFVIRCA
jgi:uncharacterized cupin superfamily protein